MVDMYNQRRSRLEDYGLQIFFKSQITDVFDIRAFFNYPCITIIGIL